jgi:hypothetical protein
MDKELLERSNMSREEFVQRWEQGVPANVDRGLRAVEDDDDVSRLLAHPLPYGEGLGFAVVRGDMGVLSLGPVYSDVEEARVELRSWSREGIVCFLVELIRVPGSDPFPHPAPAVPTEIVRRRKEIYPGFPK